LELEEYDEGDGEELCQQLHRCPQLCALRLDRVADQVCWFADQVCWLADPPEALLQAIAALPQLQHLCLRGCLKDLNPNVRQRGVSYDPQLDCGRLAVLAGCSRQLRQLTLMGMAYLPESTLVALMLGLPQLRLLRLLGCSAAPSQERCQALVGQLQLHELQVDVVVWDGSARAGWMMERLAERWREA
jgi:hypothetical protein